MTNFSDDTTIANSEGLYRRIHPIQWKYVKEINDYRVTSAAFKDNRSQISVDLSSLTTPQEALARAARKDITYALASITADDARKQEQGVVRNPLEDNPAHALIIGQQPDRVCKALARIARWVIPPPKETEET